MVGVPGRSKACSTCRSRKRGCDQQRPRCGQCTRAGISCGGYDKQRIFINTKQKDGDSSTDKFLPVSYSTRKQEGAALMPIRWTQAALPDQASPWMLTRTLERTAFELKFFDMYWGWFLPNGERFTKESAQYSTTSWTNIVQDLYHRGDAVRLALLTNALELVGRRTGQQVLIMEGWKMYTSSLLALAKLLPAATQNRTDELLAASGLLAGYELLRVAEADGSWLPAPTWLRHTSGEKAIILAKPPQDYIDGPAHWLFADYRLHLIYPELHQYKRSAFGSLEWKTIPWSLHPKTPKDELVDILVDIPGILEDIANLRGSQCGSDEQQAVICNRIRNACQTCDHQLQLWLTTTGSCTIAFVESLISPGFARDIPCSAESVAMAHLGIVYWTICNLLYQIVHGVELASVLQRYQSSNPRDYCRKILALVPYFQKSGMGAIFMNFVGFPVVVVIGYLARQDTLGDVSVERKQLAEVLEGVNGHHLRTFLTTWPWQTAKEIEIFHDNNRI